MIALRANLYSTTPLEQSLSQTITSSKNWLAETLATQRPKPFVAPYVSEHTSGRGNVNFMRRIGNTNHSAKSNPGYNRKADGGFYCH